MDNTILAEGARRYASYPSNLYLLGGFSDNVYESTANGRTIVIKYYLSSKYDKKAILSELDWVLFLNKSDLKVSAPILSINGKYLEVIELGDGEACYVSAFEKAKGSVINISNRKEWNKNFFVIWGRTLGKMHSLSMKYKPNIIPYNWNQGKVFSKNLKVSNKMFYIWEKYIYTLERLPKDKNDYGMIHNDFHHKNFYVNNNEIMLFDFGDCEYNWYVYDIAIVLYHAIETIDKNDIQDRSDFAHEFTQSFLCGYCPENQLTIDWIEKLPFFINYR
ncbi:phosphotransferase enzyme family protein [Paucisalibacillus globulus]|uniref:phosphotransferase enzyme family protein n=1 Tax=Paucisalibacillus globulus TaxID=351095 RepID=UPI0003F726F3|nr:phosphotransferase [Paucisalibacillus globulus]